MMASEKYSNASSAAASDFFQKEEERIKEETHNGETTTISNLPKEKGWTSSDLVYYQGFWHQERTLRSIITLQKHFKPFPNQILLTSYPKSGTTWLKALIFAITSRENHINIIAHNLSSSYKHIHPLLTKNPHDFIPTIEFYAIKNQEHPNPNLPVLSTHIPYQLLPENAMDSGCKIVYVARNPNDVLVSFWHFAIKFRSKELPLFPLQAAYDMFCKGASPNGPYWDHVLGFWNASLQFPERVLFLNYDEMKEDAYPHVKRLAEFLGHPFLREEEEGGAIERIISLCSFENLSNLEVNKSGEHSNGVFCVPNEVFFRKGEVGDWENYLSQEMAERLNRIVAEKFKGYGLKLHLPSKGRGD